MQQLTNEEKEALAIFSKKHNVDIRIYFLENKTHIFVKRDSEGYVKIGIDNIVSFQNILEKLEKHSNEC